jgi:uncharacterized RDD family membrane protein YckC
MYCSTCGASVAEGTAFCGACGRPIVGYHVAAPASLPVGGATVAPPYGQAPRADSILYAGFWLRVVAALIDGLVIGIPLGILFFATIVSMLPALMQIGRAANPMLIVGVFLPRILFALLVYLVASWLYWAAMESSAWQATLGKRALGLYVTDLNGIRATFGRTSGRFFAGRGIGTVPSVGGLYFLVSCILVAFTEKQQALHDIIAGTLVMRRAQG